MIENILIDFLEHLETEYTLDEMNMWINRETNLRELQENIVKWYLEEKGVNES